MTTVWMLLFFLFQPAPAAPPQIRSGPPPAPSPASRHQVTFIELGSVSCVPCRQMQPILASVEKKYGEQIKVVFYDVWKLGQRQHAERYRIKLIPTQVFLDQDGKEFFRHEGFFPEKDIDKLLQDRGLKIRGGA